MDHWNHVLWSDETKINIFGSDGVKRPGSVMVWGCMSAASTGELQFIEGTMNANMYCDILKQSMILRIRVMDWLSMSPDLNLIEHLWCILKRKVEERKVSNIHQFHDVVMEEWKRIAVATCEALVNSMPKRVKAVLGNNGVHTKY